MRFARPFGLRALSRQFKMSTQSNVLVSTADSVSGLRGGGMKGWGRGVAALLALACASGCYGIRVATHSASRTQYTTLARPKIAPDDLDAGGLRRAALASRTYFSGKRPAGSYALGTDKYTSDQIARSVDYFVRILDETPPRLLNQRINSNWGRIYFRKE